MRHLFAVIGLGRFGYSVAETLVQKGCEVLAIDLEETKIQSISDIATFAVQCDATDERALKAVSTQNVDVAVVSIGENIEASIEHRSQYSHRPNPQGDGGQIHYCQGNLQYSWKNPL